MTEELSEMVPQKSIFIQPSLGLIEEERDNNKKQDLVSLVNQIIQNGILP